MGEAAKEVKRVMSHIEQMKTRVKTSEIILVAPKKMKEAARAAEVVAVAEIRALEKSDISPSISEENLGVTLTFEKCTSLTNKAQDTEESSKTKVIDAMLQVDEANLFEMDILKKVRNIELPQSFSMENKDT
ncbi:hypothetical protein Ancab_014194 [Ancistrocladus abbreviatus]